MITTNIGKLFLETYNKNKSADYTPKRFFTEVFYPLFFDHEKYMMTGGNSPLENPKISWGKMILGQVPFETKEKRRKRYENFMEGIAQGNAGMNLAIGYPSLDIFATTSGQISGNTFFASEDDAYLSWIGAALGTCVEGGQTLFFLDSEILFNIYEGWSMYRQHLNNDEKLAGNQIAAWNARWLLYRYSYEYEEDNHGNFIQEFSNELENNKDGIKRISTVSWPRVLAGIAKNRKDNSRLLCYICNIGQTNTTYGFIPFVLDEIKKPIDLYKKFFGMEEGKKAESLWGLRLDIACQEGSIGLKAMEPYKLRKDFSKEIKYSEKNKTKFNTYKIWVMSMLNNNKEQNNEALYKKTELLAEALINYSNAAAKAKTTNANKVNAVLESKNKKSFIEALAAIVAEVDDEQKKLIIEIVKLVNNLPADNVPYFITLLKFNFAAKR